MLFAEPGKYEACGLFTKGHLNLIIITVIFIIIALKNTANKNKETVKKIIKKCTIVMWILEFIIILFKLFNSDPRNVNNYIPLYYCSMLLYAGLFSSFGKGKIKRTGDVFLATGGIVGGLVFMIMPTTSLPAYPAFHIVSIHSYFFHGTMVYIGLLINATHYIDVSANDIKYFASLVGVICILAYIVNCIFDSNLMFISEDFPGTPISIVYKLTGPLFTIIMSIIQMFLPFYIVYPILQAKKRIIGRKNNKKIFS